MICHQLCHIKKTECGFLVKSVLLCICPSISSSVSQHNSETVRRYPSRVVHILLQHFSYYLCLTQSVPMLHVAIHVGGSFTVYSNIVTGLCGMQVLQYPRYCNNSGSLSPLPCRVVNHCLVVQFLVRTEG